MTTTIYYASVIAKLPRKRKEDRFEIRMEGETPLEAKEKLLRLIADNKLRGARAASFSGWQCSESEFIDSSGVTQTMVMRSIFPNGAALAIDL